MHVINVDIQDNHEEATLGAFLICELCQCVSREGLLPWVRATPLTAQGLGFFQYFLKVLQITEIK